MSTETNTHLSRYAVWSTNDYKKPDGSTFRLLYFTAAPYLLALPTHIADHLRSERFSQLNPHTLYHLEEAGVLTHASRDDELRCVMERLQSSTRSGTRRSFVVMPTANCNLHCTYCPQVNTNHSYSKSLQQKVTQRILNATTDPKVTNVDVRWYGGEPLLAYASIMELSSSVLPVFDARGITYTSMMVTNGSLLSAQKFTDLTTKCRVKTIVVTLDGGERSNNITRINRAGRGMYRLIIDNLASIVKFTNAPQGTKVIVRVNISPTSANCIDDLLNDLHRIGATAPLFELQFMPVYSWHQDNSQHIPDNVTIDGAIRSAYHRASNLNIGLPTLPSQTKHKLCPAVGRAEEIITPDGGIFSCTEDPLVPGYHSQRQLTTIDALGSDKLRPPDRYDDWYLRINDFECSNCPLLPVCGGSCPQRWIEGQPACPPLRRELQLRMDQYAKKARLL